MNATTVKPTSAPISSVSTRNTCSSRSRNRTLHCRAGAFHQLAPRDCSPSFIAANSECVCIISLRTHIGLEQFSLKTISQSPIAVSGLSNLYELLQLLGRVVNFQERTAWLGIECRYLRCSGKCLVNAQSRPCNFAPAYRSYASKTPAVADR